MAVFENCSMLLELKNLPFKEKQKLKSAVTENGGNISYVVNKQCSLVVTNDVCNLSSNRLRGIQKHHTPVVGMQYVYACLDRGMLLPVDEHKLETSPLSTLSQSSCWSSSNKYSGSPQVPTSRVVPKLSKGQAKPAAEMEVEIQERDRNILERFRIYTEMDNNPPAYPDNFQVAKYSVFQKISGNSWCVLELQSVRGKKGQQYRVVRYWKEDIGAKGAAVRDRLVFPTTSEEALEVYQALIETLQASGLQLRDSVPPQAQDMGSAPLQQLLLEEKMNTGVLSLTVGVFVELLWSEALGCLGSILRVPISQLSLNDVSRVEGLLIQAHKRQKEGCHEEASSLLGEVNMLLPQKVVDPYPPRARVISQKLDLCQLIRDVLSVSEMTLRSPVPSSLGKYRALRCSIECIPLDSPEFQVVATLLQDSKVQIQQVLRVGRGVELQTFKSELGNVQSLFHSSSPSNFVGILSRGLLLPCVGVEQHGIVRTDVGNLGSGIYFCNATSTCLKYSKPSVTDGSRLLLVCDVALGVCKDVHERDTTLTQAPEGHDSVHAVRRTPNAHSEFEDDEYVVYSPDQVKLKYVVQFITDGDELKEFRPSVDTSSELCLPSVDQDTSDDDVLEVIENPLEDVKAGLLDSSGQQLPLQAVNVKCKLMDLLSQVIIFQKYTNLNSAPIEAKYVFPLGDSAAVCGFEAFINGKHVVGQVKEKETARKEYKKAIEKGHGAYLMDQDAADVFTISVGNLPPGATVLIKVTFVSELIVRDGSIFFSLPGSVAPWQESMALNQTTQAILEKVCMTGEAANTRDFTLDMSIEMPYEITRLHCITHKVKMKRTDCKAVVSVMPGEVMGPEGFQLSVTLSEVHLPRMWVENHPDKDMQACMLVFYPDFDISRGSESDEVILMLDTSESMRGESLHTARKIALRVLRALDSNLRVNIIFFGTDHSQAFQAAKPLSEAQHEAESFIKSFSPVGGSTELWRPLRALSLLPPSRGLRNLLLFSDGHIQNPELTLRLLRDNAQHSRIFTCGLSATANRHMLRALTQAGGGAYEFFDTKTKHTWAEKVECQVKRMVSPGCSSVSVKWQQFNPEDPCPVQAPQQVHALFNDCPTLVYGFVPHCTQATLLGNLSGQELKTMVSTTELQKTRGTFLHKLTARALIRDYEDGNLDSNEAVHEGRKAALKSYIVNLSKEFSILSQFTSFVAIEERGSEQTEMGFTDIPKLIAEEDVDILPYVGWTSPCDAYAMDIYETLETYCSQHFGGIGMMEETLQDASSSSSSCSHYQESVDEDEDDDEAKKVEEMCLDEIVSPPSPPPASVKSTWLHSAWDAISLDTSEERLVEPTLFRSVNLSATDEGTELCSVATISAPLSRYKAKRRSRPRVSVQSAEWDVDDLETVYRCRVPLAPVLYDASLPPPAPPAATVFDGSSPAPAPPAATVFDGSSPAPAPPAAMAFGASSPAPAPLASMTSFYPLQFQLSSHSLCSPAPAPSVAQGFGAPSQAPVPKAARGYDAYVQGRDRLSRKCIGAVPPPPVSLSTRSLGAPSQAPRPLPGRKCESPGLVRRHRGRAGAAPPPPASRATSAPTLAPAPPTKESTYKAASHILDVSSSASSDDDISFGVSSSEPYTEEKETEEREELSAKERTNLRCNLRFLRSAVKKCVTRPKNLLNPVERMGEAIYKPRPSWSSGELGRWIGIFAIQLPEGYWELTTELGQLIDVDVDLFANVFLKEKGIQSLGVKAHTDILRLLATLLILQLMRVAGLEAGKLLRTLFCLEESPSRPQWWGQVKRAVDWVCWADRQYPCVCSRLEFGQTWESSTRQLLGCDDPPPFSPLSGLKLRRASNSLMAH